MHQMRRMQIIKPEILIHRDSTRWNRGIPFWCPTVSIVSTMVITNPTFDSWYILHILSAICGSVLEPIMLWVVEDLVENL